MLPNLDRKIELLSIFSCVFAGIICKCLKSNSVDNYAVSAEFLDVIW